MIDRLDLRIKAIFDAAEEHRNNDGGSGDLTIKIQDDFGPMYTEVTMREKVIGTGGTPNEALAMALDWAEGKREHVDPFKDFGQIK